MTEETLEQRIQYISFLHKQNLNGRETEDELFEAGILAGIEETKEKMYSDMQEYAEFCIECDRKQMPLLLVQDWYEHYKKEIV